MKDLLESEKTAKEIVSALTEIEKATAISLDKHGILKLSAGVSFSVILHPDGVNKLNGLINNGEGFNYRSEDGKMWSVRKEGDQIVFNTRGTDKLGVPVSRLKDKIN